MERHTAYFIEGKPTYTTSEEKTREFDILKLLSRYDLLSSDFIYHEFGQEHWEATLKHLRKLVKGHYIGFPEFEEEREKLAYIPRNDFYVYELKPRGRAFLAVAGVTPSFGGNDHFLHRLLRSKVEYLLDRGPFEVRSPDDILLHPQCPPATSKLSYPFRISEPKLEPDITRGFANGDTAVFVHIEIDRGTEPKRSTKARQSLSGKIERYVQYFQVEAYKTHFGFPYAPSVLILTTRNTDDLSELIKEYAGDWAHRFFFTSAPLKPLPTTDLFVPWQGANGTLNLMELLNGRTEETGESEPASAGD